MKMLNFMLLGEPYAIAIEAFDCIWDLHNVSDFRGFEQDIQNRTLTLRWRVNRDHASREYPAEAFGLIFRSADYFEVTPRDQGTPFSEDECLHAVSRVVRGESLPRSPKDIEGLDYDLLLELQSGQHIRIGSQTAEFFLCAQGSLPMTPA